MKALKPLWHGVDTAKVGYLVDWPEQFTQTLRKFQSLRDAAQVSSRIGMNEVTHLADDDTPFIVRPMGARMMPFAFEGSGMVIFIGNTLAPWTHRKATTPNVRIEFQPFSVARHGLPYVHNYAVNLLERMGGFVYGDQLSELHVTCDVETNRPHRPSDYHTSLDKPWRKVRTRIRSNGQYHEIDASDMEEEFAGSRLKLVHIGKDKKMLRVYDKMLELKTHPDKLFESWLWNSKVHAEYLSNAAILEPPKTAVMRVEFQLRRERLIEWHISTVEHYLENQRALWEHLTEDFVVMIKNDDPNRSRCSTQQWWTVVQKAWDGQPPGELFKRPKPLPDFVKYVDQTMGLLLAIGARLEKNPHSITLEDILNMVRTRWQSTHPESWQKLMALKRENLEILWAEIHAREEQARNITDDDSAP